MLILWLTPLVIYHAVSVHSFFSFMKCVCTSYRELGARTTTMAETYSGPQEAFGLGSRDFKGHTR